MTITVIIPVLNGASFLPRCLEALKQSSVQPRECLVVDDGSEDDSAEIAANAGARVLSTERNAGPAVARNLGAAQATGEVLVFIDSDVRVHSDTLARILARFEAEPSVDALIGSYDDSPEAPNFASQYKNLLNHYFHQSGNPEASTFWSACGAIRRELFVEAGGFEESYTRPAIEDIDLGYRLRRDGHRIVLDRTILVQHLKAWTLGRLLFSDLFERALPWTRLSMESGRLPNTLNISIAQRLSALLAWISVALAAAAWKAPLLLAAALAGAAGVVVINRRLFGMFARRRGWGFTAAALPLYFAYYLYSSVIFAAGALLYLPAWRVLQRARGHSQAGAPL